MLNTDAHSPSMRKEKRMSEEDFVNNLRGIDGGQDLDQKMLQNVYRRVKNKEFKSVDDHINQVQQHFYRRLYRHFSGAGDRTENNRQKANACTSFPPARLLL